MFKISLALYLGFARERVKGRSLISSVSTAKNTLYHGQKHTVSRPTRCCVTANRTLSRTTRYCVTASTTLCHGQQVARELRVEHALGGVSQALFACLR